MAKIRQKNRVIVGCGYIGKKLITKLLVNQQLEPEQITCLVRSLDSQQQCLQFGVQSIQFELDQPQNVLPEKLALQQCVLYYFAPPPTQGVRDTRAENFIKQLLNAHKKSIQPSKIILISTTGVYGNCQGQWVTEETPLNPSVDRALRRVDAEQQFQSYCQQTNTALVILRVSGLYGPGKLPLKRIKAQTPIVQEQDSPYSNRIHADDLLEICWLAGQSDTIEGIFNCADGHPSTMCDYFTKVAQAKDLPEPPVISLEQAKTQLSAGMLSYMEESRRIDNQKLLREFNLSLQYPELEKGLAAS